MIGKFVVHWRGANSPGYIEVEGETPKLYRVKRRHWGDSSRNEWYGYGQQIDKTAALLIFDSEEDAVNACKRMAYTIIAQEAESLALYHKQQAEMQALIAQMRSAQERRPD